MKKIYLSLILLFGLSGVLHPAWSQSPSSSSSINNAILLDSIVAIVNEDIILLSDLDERTFAAAKELGVRNITVNDQLQLQLKVLDIMIVETLQKERIKQLGLAVSDQEVLEQIQDIAQQNNLSVAQLRNTLNSQETNGFQNLRNQIHQQMLFQKLREVEVLDRTQVTEGEIDNFLQRQRLQQQNIEYHLQHIMIALPENSTPQEKQQIEQQSQEILNKILQGKDFSAMALKHSTGNKALQGGDLGWLSINYIPTFFIDKVFELEQGEVSSLIPSPIGFHILKLLGQRDKDSQITTQFKLYKFTFLSEHALRAKQPPPALASLARSIRSLEAFKDLNSKFSDIPSAVNDGGKMGWKTAKQLPFNYVQALKAIPEPGRASIPFATEEGWIVLYLDNIRQTDLNQTNKRLQAMQTLRLQKANETFEIWLRRLKEEAIVDNRLINPVLLNSSL